MSCVPTHCGLKLVRDRRWAFWVYPDSIVVRLLPSRSARGHVNVPGGLAPNSVRVRVLALTRIDRENLHGADFPRQLAIRGLQDTLPERFDFAVRDDGTFVLTDLPEKPFLYLAADGEAKGWLKRISAMGCCRGARCPTRWCSRLNQKVLLPVVSALLMGWLLPTQRYAQPKVLEGTAQVSRDGVYWRVIAGPAARLVLGLAVAAPGASLASAQAAPAASTLPSTL